jgi:hypothetical protein
VSSKGVATIEDTSEILDCSGLAVSLEAAAEGWSVRGFFEDVEGFVMSSH